MKNIILFAFLIVSALDLSAQVRLEAFLTPAVGYRQLSGTKFASNQLTDSLKNADRARQNWSGGLKLVLGIDKYSALQIGVNYKGLSFMRVREDYQFHDTVHPKIGRVLDLSQTVLSKDAYFAHRYRYLSVPIIYQKAYTRKVFNSKMQFYVTTGLEFDFLIKDKMFVNLPGWSIGGEDQFEIESDYESSQVNLSFNLGSRFEYKLSERSSFSAQPAFNFPFLVTAKDEFVQFRMFQFGVSVGVNYLL